MANPALEEDAREQAQLAAVSDRNSAYYQGLMKALRQAQAAEDRSKMSRPDVVIPFQVEESDVAELQTQFGVNIRARGNAVRTRMTARVGAVSFCIEAALLEHAGGAARSVLLVDGDLMSMVARGYEGCLIERTHASPRLSTGYVLEEEQIRKYTAEADPEGMVRKEAPKLRAKAEVILQEVTNAGGEHYWPVVRGEGPKVDSVIVNHFRTPVGPHQVAWLAHLRGAVAYGAFPFQVDMMTRDQGPLLCFPGEYYIDRNSDVITLVPASDATMSISHPYSSLMDIAVNNSITIGCVEYLCEKYMSVKGIMYYTLKKVGDEFESPEVLRTWYYDTAALGVTTLAYPKIKFSNQGVPVGWERGTVSMMTSRYEKTLARVMCSRSDVVRPSEVLNALVDYNNMVINSLDTAVVAERMPVEDEEAAALAIALHVNFRSRLAKGTFSVLLDAIKKRYKVGEAGVVSLAMMAFVTWWTSPRVGKPKEVTDMPIETILDWCGTDFSVVVQDCNPWIEIAQEVGTKQRKSGRYFPYMPIPPSFEDTWYKRIMRKVSNSNIVTSGVVKDVQIKGLMPVAKPSVAAAELSKVVIEEQIYTDSTVSLDLTAIKSRLKRKMAEEQGAIRESPAVREMLRYGQIGLKNLPTVPVPRVDPKSAILLDLMEINKDYPQRDAATTGYRLAEVDVAKYTEGSLQINDAKRLIPAGRYIRRPIIDAGVEGMRVPSQMSLVGALFKRNVGIPNNRGSVDLDTIRPEAFRAVVDVCFRENWQEIIEKHLNTGMWQPNEADIETYMESVDEKKAKKMLDEFFLEGYVKLDQWMLMAKGKVKPAREEGSDHKVDHAQTILFLENSSTNAIYSAMMKRFKKCFDECLRPEVCLNSQDSNEEHEEWYNSMNGVRASLPKTYSYAADIKCYDRSQEHPALRCEMYLYKVFGLSAERLAKWEQTHGAKRAVNMMYGVVLTMVLGGVSGLWKTLFRNGYINLATLLVSTRMRRSDLVMLDIKGDDVDLETSRPLNVELSVERMSLIFNMSAKFFTNDVRYMCKQFRIKIDDRWVHVPDCWPKVQSVCTPLVVEHRETSLVERWESLRSELRHYDNGIILDAMAEACAQWYGLRNPPYQMAKALAVLASDRAAYFGFFHSPELVD